MVFKLKKDSVRHLSSSKGECAPFSLGLLKPSIQIGKLITLLSLYYIYHFSFLLIHLPTPNNSLKGKILKENI